MAERASKELPEAKVAPSGRAVASYAAIEAALTRHPRGRWFLAEYARRNRAADTQLLLGAITKLEMAVLRPQRRQESGTVLNELVAMSEAIARTRREISQITPPQKLDGFLTRASEELDQIVESTEAATSEILQAAEEMQEVAWTLREKNTDPALCDTLDERATDIYTACSFQDITGQRTAKVVQTLRFIEQRINAMIEIWGVDDIASRIATIEKMAVEDEKFVRRTGRTSHELKQDDIDAMLETVAMAQRKAAGEAPSPAGPASPVKSEVAATGFEAPEPLTLEQLHAIKRAALFG
jgi:chemotaxis regulatin CheY-phosphate phosphatase CheZ